MKKFWKWFFIVIGAMIVLGVIAVAVIGFTHGFGRMGFIDGRQGGFEQFSGRQDGFMMPGRRGGFGMMPGTMIFGLLISCAGLLVVLGLIALVVWVVIKMTSKKTAIATGATSSPSPDVNPVDAAPLRICLHCGKPAHEDWVTCPYCGGKL
jgi:flagellar basal body-associated protein FliL